MKKTKVLLSIRSYNFWSNIVMGIFLVLICALAMFDNLIICSISLVLSLIAIILKVYLMRIGHEQDDEMSTFNYTKARAKASYVMSFVYLVFGTLSFLLLSMLPDLELPWHKVIAYLIFGLSGINDIIVGIAFKILEAE